MERRQFLRAAGAVAASASLAGCAGGTGGDGSGPEGAGEKGDANVRIVRSVPFEDDGGTPEDAETAQSDLIGLERIQFQRAGQKGLVVAGDATNRSDRTFEDFYVEVTLYDENETEDELLDQTSNQEEHDEFGAGESWQWAVTFEDEPLPEIDYYAVEAVGTFD